jgi:hypothetical protein
LYPSYGYAELNMLLWRMQVIFPRLTVHLIWFIEQKLSSIFLPCTRALDE